VKGQTCLLAGSISAAAGNALTMSHPTAMNNYLRFTWHVILAAVLMQEGLQLGTSMHPHQQQQHAATVGDTAAELPSI
jgi:hypothetical protein